MTSLTETGNAGVDTSSVLFTSTTPGPGSGGAGTSEMDEEEDEEAHETASGTFTQTAGVSETAALHKGMAFPAGVWHLTTLPTATTRWATAATATAVPA